MPPEAAARVRRLEKWVRVHRKDLVTQDGQLSPSLLAQATEKKASYWSDVLRLHKSFGDKTARDAEVKLGMPALYLEGLGWPFEAVELERFSRLTERQKGRVEQAMLDALARIEAEPPAAPPPALGVSVVSDAVTGYGSGTEPTPTPRRGSGKRASSA